MKPRILFVHDQKHVERWNDGFRLALELLSAEWDIVWHSVLEGGHLPTEGVSFVLGRGDWGGNVDHVTRSISIPKGLAICGNARDPESPSTYDVLFYESPLQQEQLHHPNLIHAFGVNTEINRPLPCPKIIDYLTVGAFATWKRQSLLTHKKGVRLAVGEIQQGNLQESLQIISELLSDGVGVMDSIPSDKLTLLYNASHTVYIPADVYGGGERAVLEARACGVQVEVEEDNPKLKWFLDGPIYDQNYYVTQFKKGIAPYL